MESFLDKKASDESDITRSGDNAAQLWGQDMQRNHHDGGASAALSMMSRCAQPFQVAD